MAANRFLSSLYHAGAFACVNGSGICIAAFVYSLLIGDPEHTALRGTLDNAGAMLEHYRLMAGARYFVAVAGALWLAGAIYLHRRAVQYAPVEVAELEELRQEAPAPESPVKVPANSEKRLVETACGVLRYVHVQGG